MTESLTYRLALVGFGAVGQGLAQILARRGAWLERQYGLTPRIVAVCTRSWGAYRPDGLDPEELLLAAETRILNNVPHPRRWEPLEMIAEAAADVLVEISPTDTATGEPATSYIRAALQRGMHVVTANKGPIALHGAELLRLARERGVSLGYEATVMAGTPALRLGWSDLAGCELREAHGIVNGTTNFILTQMDAGKAYGEALAEAQRLGYAEADPAGDVEGHDAAAKAVILANMLFGAALRPADVEREGITRLTPEDVAAAHAAGERWKLIARVTRDGDQVIASVRPTRLPLGHPLAAVGGATNALAYTTDLLGEVTLVGPGAGGVATGFGLLSDILAIRHGRR